MTARSRSSIEALEALPGVGPYTARAVAAIAFGARVGAVDVNVRRVIGRLVAGSPDALSTRELQTVADAAVPSARPADWTHAVMDLGATVCRARSPACPSCPARAWCRAASTSASTRALRAKPATARTGVAGRHAPSVPFHATTRWLRGRIMDRLRDASDGTWVELDDAIGGHASADVAATLTRMARDGVIELGPTDDGRPRARLPLA